MMEIVNIPMRKGGGGQFVLVPFMCFKYRGRLSMVSIRERVLSHFFSPSSEGRLHRVQMVGALSLVVALNDTR